MITGIDHIVIAASSLERAIESYRALGFTVVPGGRHPYGSHNALIAFADGSYIELISFYERSPAHPWWGLLRERGGGWVDFCMATDDIRADIAALRRGGVDSGELTEGGRARPDGYHVRWINNKVGGHWQGLIPFVIEDVTPRAERLPRETAHANGVSGIASLVFATRDVERYGGVMAAATGAKSEPIYDNGLAARGLRMTVGGQALEYLAPDGEGSPLAAHLAAHGASPYCARFWTDGEASCIDPADAEGARIDLIGPA